MLLGGFIAIATGPHALARHMPNKLAKAHSTLKAIELSTSGRLGVATLDTAGPLAIAYNADQRFAMCSTFKLIAVATTLKRVDDNAEHLDRTVVYGPGDLLEYAPIAKQHVQDGGMTVAALCAAAIEYSDNTAANLLLRDMGGPGALTRFARSIGDPVTRLDRNEPTLNEATPGDPRDTTTPAAMAADMKRVLLGNALSAESRTQLLQWLAGNTTGADRLRAGLPAGWQIGDKTGTGKISTNDIAIITPPGRKPILATAYLTETKVSAADRVIAIRNVGQVIAALYG